MKATLIILSVLCISASAWNYQSPDNLAEAYVPIKLRTGVPLEDFVSFYQADVKAFNMTMMEWIQILVNESGKQVDSNSKRDICTSASGTCDDGNECTAGDRCRNNPSGPGFVCEGLAYTTEFEAPCNDGNQCTSDDTCKTGGTCSGITLVCDDNNACTTNACDASIGCTYTAISCNNGNRCTDDSCNPSTGCTYTTANCDDTNPCTTDSCNPATGCVHTAKTSFNCDNGSDKPLANRCEITPTSETSGQNLCQGHPYVKDDNPNLAPGYNEGFCDCYSGWSGQQCNVKEIGTSDKLPPVDTVGRSFQTGIPDIDPQDEIDSRPALALTISLPSSQSALHNPDNLESLEKLTRLVFKAPTQTTPTKRTGDLYIPRKRIDPVNPMACNYPNNPRWNLDTTEDAQQGWIDTYSNSFDYAELANRGLSFVNQDDNYAYFNTSLQIEREFTISNGRFSFDRTFSVNQVISIEFPRHLSVSTNVIVSNNTVEFYAAVTIVHFDPINQVWNITISTAINKPFYKLELSAPVANPNPTSPTRDWIAVGNNLVAGSCPGDYSGDCKQEWKYQTHSCDALNIEALTMNFKVVCISGNTPNSPPGECASLNEDQDEPQAVIRITTARACPLSEKFKITGSSLSSYDASTYTTTKGLFRISENMYLGVDFNAPPAGIASIKITALKPKIR